MTNKGPINIPEDVEYKLNKIERARVAWDKLAPSHKREYLKWIDEAKKIETRSGRIDKMILMVINKGKK